MKNEVVKKEVVKEEAKEVEKEQEKTKCGIIMPISSIDNCPPEHWAEVKRIIKEAFSDAGYEANLVSEADDSGIIQKRIIHNIYDNDLVVCDVSGKNPNVMFELGMRLAFDKPTIIVIDDKTDYSFDTSPIEHIKYSRDLHYFNILDFKEELTKKIKGTLDKAKNDPNYTTFLKNFGQFEVAHIEKKEGSFNEVVLSTLEDITHQISTLQRQNIGIRAYSNRETVSERRARAKEIIKNEIDIYCSKNGIDIPTLFYDKNNERQELFNQLAERQDIRELCRDPETLRQLIDSNLAPF